MQNIEIKARLRDRAHALAACERLGAVAKGDLRQTDTYFQVPGGRLKVRDFGDGSAELIFYHRPDTAGPKCSDYELQAVPPGLAGLLSHALGCIAVVIKTRTLFLWRNVRIHLDQVEGLGDFLEFEAVVSESEGVQLCRERVDLLLGEFDIRPEDLLETSYLELVRESRV